MVRDLAKGDDPQIAAVVAVISRVRPDILLLNDFDYDYGGVALGLFADALETAGISFAYRFALRPNSGLASGRDLDGDGRLGGPGDAQGFGFFAGQQGMALLSRFPVAEGKVRDFSQVLWGVDPEQRLSSKGHWDVPVQLPNGRFLHVLASHPTPPVFDGADDRNGKRNEAEISFWASYIDREVLDGPFAVMGDLNADPMDGEGSHEAISVLLAHPLVQDPEPESRGAVVASSAQAGPNLTQKSPARFDTVDWDEARTPGNMRVDYVLPSSNLTVSGAGVFWPAPDEDGFDLLGPSGDLSSHHRLVWVDIGG